jgi:hypothetical protein
LNLWLMIEAAPGANECSQCLQIQLNALPARSSLTPFLKLRARAGCDVTRILRRPLSRVTPSRGALISIFPAGWAERLKPTALVALCKRKFSLAACEAWEPATRYWKNRCVAYFLFCGAAYFACRRSAECAWEAAARYTPGRLFSFSLVRVAVLFMRLWRVKADDAAGGERIGEP